MLLAIPMHGLLFACWDAYQLAVETLAEAIGAPATRGMWGEASQAFILFESMFIGPALAVILNTPIYLERCSFLPPKMVGFFARWHRQILNGALESNHFEQLTMRALDTSLPMMVTMKTGKVYVGWALDIPNPAEERKTFRLLPILSGYRDERHKVCFTTDYEVALDDTSHSLSKQDFYVVIETDQICTSRLFDLQIFKKYFQAEVASEVTEALPPDKTG